MPKTDLFLNATVLNYLACDRHYQVTALWGIRDTSSAAANFGNDFHTFAYHLEGPDKKSFMDQATNKDSTIPLATNKDLGKLCLFYEASPVLKNSTVLYDNNGEPFLEYKFEIPYLETADYRIILVGTIDRGDRWNDAVRILDRKTSRKPKPADVLQGYTLQIQVPFYMYVYKKYLAQFFGPVIENLPIVGQYLGVFMSFEPPKFELSNPINYTPSLEIEIEDLIHRAAEQMIRIHKLGPELAPPTGMAAKISDENVCKYCFLNRLCVLRDHDALMKYLKAQPHEYYDPRKWR